MILHFLYTRAVHLVPSMRSLVAHKPPLATFATKLPTPPSSMDPAEQHAMFEEQMMELREERESQFGFDEQDIKAWGKGGGLEDLVEVRKGGVTRTFVLK